MGKQILSKYLKISYTTYAFWFFIHSDLLNDHSTVTPLREPIFYTENRCMANMDSTVMISCGLRDTLAMGSPSSIRRLWLEPGIATTHSHMIALNRYFFTCESEEIFVIFLANHRKSCNLYCLNIEILFGRDLNCELLTHILRLLLWHIMHYCFCIPIWALSA